MDASLDRLRKEIEDATGRLSGGQWCQAPAGAWNTAQILEHLGRTYGTTAKMLELAMGVCGEPNIRRATWKELVARFVVLDLEYLPKAKSPTQVLPKGDPGPIALERAINNLDRMCTALNQAEARWGKKNPIALHPVLGPLNTTQWRKFHYMHGHHHLKQIRSRTSQ